MASNPLDFQPAVENAPAADGAGVAAWILKVTVAATVLGMVVGVFRDDGSSINAYLFLELGFSHHAAANIERAAVVLVSVLAGVCLVWPRSYVLVPIAAYLLAEAVAGYRMRGYAFSDWTVAAHALRYLTPLALVLIARAARHRSAGSLWSGMWLLRTGLAAVFLTHGYEALQSHPAFIDLIITTAQNLLHVRIEEATARTALQVIGWVDVAAALLVLIRPWRVVLLWMLFWGLVTAFSRVTSYGWGAHTDVLVRTSHFMVPLAMLWLSSVSTHPTGSLFLSRRR